jgi:hypothetical protein
MSKLDLKKELKELYKPSKNIIKINVPELQYLMIEGEGSPEEANGDFQKAMETIYPVAYTIKFTMKDIARDFVVMPLQALWYADDYNVYQTMEMDKWKWTVMILLPNYVNHEIFQEAIDKIKTKQDVPTLIDKIKLNKLIEDKCFQITHYGPYAEEGSTLQKLHDEIESNGYKFAGLHHEIYLSDPRRAKPENMKTLIRQPVKK